MLCSSSSSCQWVARRSARSENLTGTDTLDTNVSPAGARVPLLCFARTHETLLVCRLVLVQVVVRSSEVFDSRGPMSLSLFTGRAQPEQQTELLTVTVILRAVTFVRRHSAAPEVHTLTRCV